MLDGTTWNKFQGAPTKIFTLHSIKKFVRHENENIKATKSQKMSAAKKEMQKYLNAPT